jgi:UDP-N-acetylglucosamine 3-dehydrogenase
MNQPPVGVILFGAGAMGRNHGRVLRQSRDCFLVGVIEPDAQRGAPFAAELGVYHWTSLDECLADQSTNVQAAVIATPTSTHEELTMACFDRGLDVLVEKPIADELSAAARMVARAAADDRVLMVGHIERFNGAVIALPNFLDDPVHFSCQRVGPYDPRILDGIILDLMIHDLDIVSHLTKQPGVPNGAISIGMHGRREDHATASVLFGSRTSASFTASRVGQTKARTIEIVQPSNSISVDLIRQDITIHTIESVDFSGPGNTLRQRGLVEIPFIERSGQPLAAELSHFAACVRREATCLTPGEDGLQALELVRNVERIAAVIDR